MASSTFPSGGTNSQAVTYTDATTIGAAGTTIINTTTGSLIFEVPPGTTSAIDGSLANAGTVSYTASSAGAGATFTLGDEDSSLTQTGGTLSFNDLNETSGATVSLGYGEITNDSTSVITINAAGASTINATNLADLTNQGTITLVDSSGAGLTSEWGNGTGVLTNSGSFIINDGAATSSATTSFDFTGFINTGTFGLTLPAASTATIEAGAGGVQNSGTLSITSKGGLGNIQFTSTGGISNTGTINVADATVVVQDSVSGTGGVWNLSGGAKVSLEGATSGAGQVFTFSGGKNTLFVQTGSGFTGTLQGFSQGDQLNVGIPGVPVYDRSTGDLTVSGAVFQIGLGYTGTFSDGFTGIITYKGSPACFLTGTLIETTQGRKPVEAVAVGDVLVAYEQRRQVTRTVRWVGRQSVDLSTLSNPETAYPVRVRRHALAPNVPFKDLLLTPEHCLYLDGGFVPVRMLVNGGSIAFDGSITRYDYHHVETDTHAVIVADGAASESYLDTGNRHSFLSGDDAPCQDRQLDWAGDAAAPLINDRASVEPIWARLAERSVAIGLAIETVSAATADPDLRLLLDDGHALASCQVQRQRHSFLIPAGRRATRLLSRTAVPASSIGPFVDDRRTLGVAVEKLVRWNGLEPSVIMADTLDLPGWHQAEGASRWTAGCAVLDLPMADAGSYLDVHVAGTLSYPTAPRVAA